MVRETEAQYLARREQEELARARSSATALAGAVHAALATGYHVRRTALAARSGTLSPAD